MKKTIALLMALVLTFAVTGCSQKAETVPTTSTTTTAEKADTGTAAADTADTTANVAATAGSDATVADTDAAASDNAGNATASDTAAETAVTETVPADTDYEKHDVNVYVLAGPTGVGAANLMVSSEAGEALENYKFTVVSDGSEIVSKISTGEADIAAIATNLAAKLYKKTSGGIQILAVNTLGVLNVLNFQGEHVSSLAELKGRTIYTTGQGSNPEFVIRYLLSQQGVDPDKDVTIEYKAEGSALTTVWETDPTAVIISPQPVATSILLKYEGSAIDVDLTNTWDEFNSDSQLMMGCVVARTEYINEHPEVIKNFLVDYRASIEATGTTEYTGDDKQTYDADTTAALIATTAAACETYGIVPKAALAKKAMPGCHICFITGIEMKTKLTGYLSVLFAADPTSVGGAMPDDGFWYIQ